MNAFSRKKIRGLDRKLKQLDAWKNFILDYPFSNETKTSGQIFRVQLSPFIWYQDKNPNIKFHKYLYEAYADILQKLKEKEVVKANKLTVQLWLFYPRTVRSLIIVATEEQKIKRNNEINATETMLSPPKIICQVFTKQRWKLGVDNVFETIEGPMCLTHKIGDIWTAE